RSPLFPYTTLFRSAMRVRLGTERRRARGSPHPGGLGPSGGRPRTLGGHGWESALLAGYDRRASIREDFLTGDIPPFGDRAGERHVVEQIATPARFEVVDDAVALVVDMRLDLVRGLGLPRLEDHAHVLVGGADPDLREGVEHPDPDVVPDPHVRAGQLVGQVLRPPLEVVRAGGRVHRRPPRDGGGALSRDRLHRALLRLNPATAPKR